MYLLGSQLLLLLEYVASSDLKKWRFEHPNPLYAWEGACIWIPCEILSPVVPLENITMYHNPNYDDSIKEYNGTMFYRKTKVKEFPYQKERVQYLGNLDTNCTLNINPVHVHDSGLLGLRVMTTNDKWMEKIHLNVSKTPFPPRIQLPERIEEYQTVTVTCLLDFACFGYDIQLQWSFTELNSSSVSAVASTSLSTKTVLTQNQLTFCPQWTHHGKKLTCRLLHSSEVLSERTVQLDVKHHPKVKIQVNANETIVMKGESVTMTCYVTSSNPEYKTISWFKDNIKKLEQKPTLILSEVTKEMKGDYHCEASSDLGTGVSEKVTLEVLYAPEPSKVSIHPLPAEEGNSVELVCISPANPSATNYTWYHNEKEMPGRTEEKFQLSRVVLRDAGHYSCLAENIYGRGERGQGAELDVLYTPKNVTITVESSTPIREGDSVTLRCAYNSSNPEVTHYKWSPQGAWNKPSSEWLRIQKIAWNAASISCAACNPKCSWTDPLNLHVQYAPRDVKVLKISPQSEIHAGHQVHLTCDFSTSYPKEVRFFWRKNGSLLKEGRKLIFDSISPEDAGNYSCLVNNSVGQTLSKAWRLQVLYKPRRLHVSIVPGDRVMEGRKAALTCESDANPPVSRYAWFDWNNKDLQCAEQTLRLEPLKIAHSGSYWCQGFNHLGKGESPPTTLTVFYSPETIGRRVAVGMGLCLAILILAIWGMKIHQSWKRTQSQQGLQENCSGQSFFVRNKKVRRAPRSEGPASLGCYNPVIEDSVSYAALRFPETNTQRTGNAGTSETQGPLPKEDGTVTYSVVQRRGVGDYENVTPNLLEDEGIHYSELVQFGAGKRPQAQEDVEYVTLKH